MVQVDHLSAEYQFFLSHNNIYSVHSTNCFSNDIKEFYFVILQKALTVFFFFFLGGVGGMLLSSSCPLFFSFW